MEKVKEYKNTFFSADTLKKAIFEFDALVKEATIRYRLKKENQSDEECFRAHISRSMSIGQVNETWRYDLEDEFFADYRKYVPDAQGSFSYKRNIPLCSLEVKSAAGTHSIVSVNVYGHKENRAVIERIFDVFEADAQKSKLSYDIIVKPKVFIGHGRSNQWRELKDHLHDKHAYAVVAYETGARAGHAIRDVLEEMLTDSSFAVLVMTAEDQTADGQFRARQNVVHEIGLFQGRLGFNRAVILLEDETEEFSNIYGIGQIRFSKENIKETFGEVLAVIKREFY